MSLTTLLLSCLEPWKGPVKSVSQSVRKSVSHQIVKTIQYWIYICHPSGESRKQEACWEWASPPWVSTYRHLDAHRFNRYSEVTPFINLPSRNCFRRTDDKCEIGQPAKPAKVLTGGRRLARSASRRPPVCLPFRRVTALLGTVTDFLTLTGNMLTLTFLESGWGSWLLKHKQ